MSIYILPILIILLFAYSFFKKVNVYKSFVEGAKGAFELCLDIFPYITAILIAVALFRSSGIANFLINLIGHRPYFRLLAPQYYEAFLQPINDCLHKLYPNFFLP